MKKLGKTFKIEDQGELSDYLGIKIERKSDGKSFKGRGVGSFMVGLCQSLLKGISMTQVGI